MTVGTTWDEIRTGDLSTTSSTLCQEAADSHSLCCCRVEYSPRQAAHTHTHTRTPVSVTKQCNLVQVEARKVTEGLASHWPCVYTTRGFKGLWDEHTGYCKECIKNLGWSNFRTLWGKFLNPKRDTTECTACIASRTSRGRIGANGTIWRRVLCLVPRRNSGKRPKSTWKMHLEDEEMWTVGYKYSWRKMEAAAQNRAGWQRKVGWPMPYQQR